MWTLSHASRSRRSAAARRSPAACTSPTGAAPVGLALGAESASSSRPSWRAAPSWLVSRSTAARLRRSRAATSGWRASAMASRSFARPRVLNRWAGSSGGRAAGRRSRCAATTWTPLLSWARCSRTWTSCWPAAGAEPNSGCWVTPARRARAVRCFVNTSSADLSDGALSMAGDTRLALYGRGAAPTRERRRRLARRRPASILTTSPRSGAGISSGWPRTTLQAQRCASESSGAKSGRAAEGGPVLAWRCWLQR